MSASLPLADDVVADAVHGSYCPKMCTFACPVAEATGRDDAVPWSFHHTVVDLSQERMTPQQAALGLRACSGCMGCQQPCDVDQDVPAQVRAGRAAVDFAPGTTSTVVAHLRDGRRPDGSTPPSDELVTGAPSLLVGCHDDPDTVAAARALMAAAGGGPVSVVQAPGCCGQLAADLGAPDVAAERAEALAAALPTGVVVALDPHCLDATRAALPDADVVDLWTHLAAHRDRLAFAGEPLSVTYHDPCILARPEGVVSAPRTLLADAGVRVVEPEFHGSGTACSGAGMGLPSVDADAAAATAARRAAHLQATGVPAATACTRARAQLSAAGAPTHDLAQLLSRRLAETGS